MSDSPNSSSSESWEHLSQHNYWDTLLESDVENRAVALPPLSQGSNLSAATDTEDSETQSTPSLGQRDLDCGVLLTDSGSGHNTAETAMTINLGQSPTPDEEASDTEEQQSGMRLQSELGGADHSMDTTTCGDDSYYGEASLQRLADQLMMGNDLQRRSACQEVVKRSNDAVLRINSIEACVEEGVVAGVAHSLLSKDVAVQQAAIQAMQCLALSYRPLCYTAQRVGVSTACTLLWEAPEVGLQLLDAFFNISPKQPAYPDPAQLTAMKQACLDRGALLQVVHILQNPFELVPGSSVEPLESTCARLFQIMSASDPATLQLLALAAPTLMTTLLHSESSVAMIAAASLLGSIACLESDAGNAAVEQTLPALLDALASTMLSSSGQESLDGSASVALLTVAHQLITANDIDTLVHELASDYGLLVLMCQPGGGPLLEIVAELVRCGATSTDAVIKALTDLPASQTKGAKMALVDGSGEKGFKEQLLLSALKVGIAAKSHRGFTAADCVAILLEQLEWRITIQDAVGLESLLCIIWINEVALYAADNRGDLIPTLRKAAAASWAPVPCQAIAISLLEGLHGGGYSTNTSLLTSDSLADVLAGIASSDPVVRSKQLDKGQGTLASAMEMTAIRLIADATKVFAAAFMKQVAILPTLLQNIAVIMRDVNDSSVLLTFLAAGQQMLQQPSVSQSPRFIFVAEIQMQLVAGLIRCVRDTAVLLECIRVGDQLIQQSMVSLIDYTKRGRFNQRHLSRESDSNVGSQLKQRQFKHLKQRQSKPPKQRQFKQLADNSEGSVLPKATAQLLQAVFRSLLQPASTRDLVYIDVRLAAAGFVNRWLPEVKVDAELYRTAWEAGLKWMACSMGQAESLLALTTFDTVINREIACQGYEIHLAAQALPILLDFTASNDTDLSEKAFAVLKEVYSRWGDHGLMKRSQDASIQVFAAAAMPSLVAAAGAGGQRAVFSYGLVEEMLANGFISKDQLCVSGGAIVSAIAALQSLLECEIPANNAPQLAAIDLLARVKGGVNFQWFIQKECPSAVSNLISLLQLGVLPSVAAGKLRAVTAAILSSLQESLRTSAALPDMAHCRR